MHLRKRADVPAPVVVSTSGKFEGNDGKWSTFLINLNSDQDGINGQDFRVLPSTYSSLTLVPGATEWCDDACAQRRGVELRGGRQPEGNQQDGSWSPDGQYAIPIPDWFPKEMVVTNGNLTLRGRWGKTQVGLGSSNKDSPVLTDRYAVSYLSEEFFLGFFGLANGVVGSGPGATLETFLQQFRTSNNIATVSYGYSAGAWYRNNQNGALGSLVLGGYDQSRLGTPALTVRMPDAKNSSLIVGVPSMIYAPNTDVAKGEDESFTADCGGFRANIDSTLPYLILPECICNHFEDKFGLDYDKTANLYFVNASSHERNLQQNGTIDFKIVEGPTDSSKYTNIRLSYSAFDQQISSRTGTNERTYFPIKKSQNGLFTLGRTFLQETYLIVDYERSNFTVAPAIYTGSTPQQNLQIIYNTTYNPEASSSSSSSGLGPGAIAGTVVGIVVAFAIAGVIAFCWWRKQKNKQQEVPKPYETQQIDPSIAGQEIKYRRVSELTGSDLPMSPKSPVGDYYSVDHKTVPPISEMSPDSPPVELYSPPAESTNEGDYFTGKFTRRGAQRDRASSGFTTPGTPIAELPGDEGQFHTPGSHFDAVSPISPPQTRGPSDTSLSTNIDERLADHKKDTNRPAAPTEAIAADEDVGPKNESQAEDTTQPEKERRPSHQRGLSDTTIASDSTAVSQPTPEERERWERERSSGRPLSE
ncbi:hypothetical protein E8E13_002628 [Curvularia kusanoi]|uniref:Peptidase A1 domain-containing protein n=1 Tax=Curvularia kusanoi TaxID=90978 RepID=A0A9P4T8F9_CURKU|nr:hypothetical protein E8E13_002628 [Curvularia kusanoi]